MEKRRYMVTLTYLVAVDAVRAGEAERIAQEEVEMGKWNPKNLETVCAEEYRSTNFKNPWDDFANQVD